MKYLMAFLLCLLLLPPLARADATPQPRVLIGLYDSIWEASPRSCHIHRFIEMPANHLGFDIHYYDVNEPLPKLGNDVVGIVTWFDEGTTVKNPSAYLSWLNDALNHGKKLVIFENAGIGDNIVNKPELMQLWDKVLAHIGLHDDSGWHDITYNASLEYTDKNIIGFERQVGPLLPPFAGTHAIPGEATSHLRVHLKQDQQDKSFDLVTTSPQGGYIAEGYALFYVDKNNQSDFAQWYINPFKFLQEALGVKLSPVPDVTTLDGRRIFYSQIDGDGWNNISEIPKFRRDMTISAKVIEDEILKPYSDLPFSVALITADVDPNCYAMRDSAQVAREIFALPNVEPSSHTYTHPLFWQFFEHYTPAEEEPFLSLYPPRAKGVSLLESLRKHLNINDLSKRVSTHKIDISSLHLHIKRGRNDESIEDELNEYYNTPRSYYCGPFNLSQEIIESAKIVDELSPPDKKTQLIQWSGNTSPFEAALAMARKAGLYNINGGSTRFDNEHPSYSFVAPIGIKVGDERQIYASSSNENTYTDLWTDRFFAYRYLKDTIERTDSPIRILPFDIYFHMFSGQKEASLKSIKYNLDYARTQEIIPIATSHYASIAEGFYSAQVTPLGATTWRIDNRGTMNTFRFDNATNLSVDFTSSKGVIGQRYFENNLYVALDPAAKDVVISLKGNSTVNALPVAKIPYLVESSWNINNVRNTAHALTFNAQGYGHGILRWNMPESGKYLVKAIGRKSPNSSLLNENITVNNDHQLIINLDGIADIEQISVTVLAL